jgi:hypothetical protein
MTELIMHRRPEKMDEDWNGEVLMLRFPDGGVSSRGETYALVAAAHVGPGVPWKRTDMWEPPATPEPQPDPEPEPEPHPEKPQVGQVWRTRRGKYVTITCQDAADGFTCTTRHLIKRAELLEPVTYPKVPRLFAAPPVRTWAPDGMGLIDALATDGTAWHRYPRDPQWTQHPLLPDREEPADA